MKYSFKGVTKTTKSDWIIIAVVASISVTLLGLRFLPVSGEQIQAQVELEGNMVQTINLQESDGSRHYGCPGATVNSEQKQKYHSNIKAGISNTGLNIH